jgi:hypothetical protein
MKFPRDDLLAALRVLLPVESGIVVIHSSFPLMSEGLDIVPSYIPQGTGAAARSGPMAIGQDLRR